MSTVLLKNVVHLPGIAELSTSERQNKLVTTLVYSAFQSEASVWRGVGSVKQLKPPYSLVTSSISQAVQHGRHQVLDRRLHHLALQRHHHALQACCQIWSVDNLDFCLDLMSVGIDE